MCCGGAEAVQDWIVELRNCSSSLDQNSPVAQQRLCVLPSMDTRWRGNLVRTRGEGLCHRIIQHCTYVLAHVISASDEDLAGKQRVCVYFGLAWLWHFGTQQSEVSERWVVNPGGLYSVTTDYSSKDEDRPPCYQSHTTTPPPT